jgi:hypothetical protein
VQLCKVMMPYGVVVLMLKPCRACCQQCICMMITSAAVVLTLYVPMFGVGR